MSEMIRNQAVDLFAETFERLFIAPIRGRISDRTRQRKVIRQIEAVADAAAQGLARFLSLEPPASVDLDVLFAAVREALAAIDPAELSPPGGSPEARAEAIGNSIGSDDWPPGLQARARVALELVVAAVWQAGAVFHAWEQVKFSDQYEPPRTLVRQLEELDSRAARRPEPPNEAKDEQFELQYRDYLLQRWGRIEVGTLRAVPAVAIGVDDLFVMPRVASTKGVIRPPDDALFEHTPRLQRLTDPPNRGEIRPADEALFDRSTRLKSLIGPPGIGKSTLLLWTQRQVAACEREYVLADQQAVPVLIRVRDLVSGDPPRGRRLVELATGSRDIAALMPDNWIERQFAAGRVLLLLDGMDETDASIRDGVLLPWLVELLRNHPGCHAVLTSRPAGFPEEAFQQGGAFADWRPATYTVQDFDREARRKYLENWCTQVRIARGEPSAEASQRGIEDAAAIFAAVSDHPSVAELARTPLLLSAICLVYHFEGGRLPDDRAVLYRLCVEGLLDRWDAQKGLRSPFTADEKLRVCRELAVAMATEGTTECSVEWARSVARSILGTPGRGDELIDHMRSRAGLITERTPGKLSFAHLTFQEYLTALAVRDDNRHGVTIQTLADNHTDPRWREVILLFCRLAPPALARELLSATRSAHAQLRLPPSAHPKYGLGVNHTYVSLLLTAYRSCPSFICDDRDFRAALVAELVSTVMADGLEYRWGNNVANSLQESPFSDEEIVNAIRSGAANRAMYDFYPLGINLGGWWLFTYSDESPIPIDTNMLDKWSDQRAGALRQVVWQYYCFSSHEELNANGIRQDLWRAPLSDDARYVGRLQAEAALLGLSCRVSRLRNKQGLPFMVAENIFDRVPEDLLIELLECYADSPWEKGSDHSWMLNELLGRSRSKPSTPALARRFESVCTAIAERLGTMTGASVLYNWVDSFTRTR
jgi:hypothetical protein